MDGADDVEGSHLRIQEQGCATATGRTMHSLDAICLDDEVCRKGKNCVDNNTTTAIEAIYFDMLANMTAKNSDFEFNLRYDERMLTAEQADYVRHSLSEFDSINDFSFSENTKSSHRARKADYFMFNRKTDTEKNNEIKGETFSLSWVCLYSTKVERSVKRDIGTLW